MFNDMCDRECRKMILNEYLWERYLERYLNDGKGKIQMALKQYYIAKMKQAEYEIRISPQLR